MKSSANYILLTLILAAGPADYACAQVKVYAKVDSTTDIYPGDSFTYSVVIEGGDKAAQVDLAPIAKYNPQHIGNQSSFQMVNRRTTSTYTMNYAITATRAGKIHLDPLTVTVAGRRYKTNPVEVTVSTPGTTDKLRLEFLLSEKKCYVGQPVIMTVKWYIMAEVRNSVFNVPVFLSGDFYLDDLPEPRTVRRRQKYAVHNVPVIINEEHKLIKGVNTGIISFKKVLIPKRSGQLRLAPVSVATNVAVGQVRTRDIFNRYRTKYQRFSVSSKPVQLQVLPLPQQGKPRQFYGLVGRYTISASAKPTTVSVGDPITMTIKIGGSDFLKPVQWPALEQVPKLADSFRIPAEKSSPTIQKGFKVFTQTVRANNPNVTHIPAIPLAFFDPDQGKYTVARTRPIKLTVTPTKILTSADLEGLDFAPVNKEIEAIKKGPSENSIGVDVLQDMSFSPLAAVFSPAHATLWSLPLAALIFSTLFRLLAHTSPEKIAARRRRTAAAKALKQLKKLPTAPADQRHELLVSAMKQYIGERFDRTAGSLTPYDCQQAIALATGESQIADEYRDIIADCETGRYAAIQTNVDTDQVKTVTKLIRDVEKKSKR
ncbi:MAG: BatD family protein [Planctomycetota bacterium]|jgi:hypothetical protein